MSRFFCINRYLPVCVAVIMLTACTMPVRQAQRDAQKNRIMDELLIADRLCGHGENLGYNNDDFNTVGKSRKAVDLYFTCMAKAIPTSSYQLLTFKASWDEVFEHPELAKAEKNAWEIIMQASKDQVQAAQSQQDWQDTLMFAMQYNAAHPTMNCSSIGHMAGTMTCN